MRRMPGILLSAMLATAALSAATLTTGVASAATGAHRSASTATLTAGVVPTAWSIVPSPTFTSGEQLAGVSCPTSSFCVAVGSTDASPHQTLIQQWNGTAWVTIASPNTSSSEINELAGISCVTSSFCVAVGHAMAAGHSNNLVEQWNGVAWTITPSPNAASTLGNQLTAVSCPSTTFCTAVGHTVDNPAVATAIVWNGLNWALGAPANPTATSGNTLAGVACRSTSWCVAVGATNPVAGLQALVEQWNGTAWTVVASPPPTSSQTSSLSGVACPSTSQCAAVGFTSDGSTSLSLVEQWNGTAWSAATLPTVAGTVSSSLSSVSCTGPSSCTAVGTYELPALNHLTASLTWNGSTWAFLAPKNPAVNGGVNNDADLAGVSCVGGQACIGVGFASPGAGTTRHGLVESAPVTRPGYRMVASDGGIFTFGGASFNGSAGSLTLNKPVVGMAATPDGAGYWLVASDGGIFTYGDAAFHGSTGGIHLNMPIVGMAPTPDGAGYWLVASDGGIFSFGDATFHGSTGAMVLNKPIVGMAATPDGHGYWLVASDGGIFSFGDATFHGSTGAIRLNKPVVGMAATPSGRGYWLDASDGGIFSFGDATFHGSTGAIVLNKPMVGMTA